MPHHVVLRSLFGEPLDWTDRLPVAAVVAIRVVMARREKVETTCVVVAVRAWDGRPVVAARTGIEKRRPIAAAGAGEEDAFRSVITPAANSIPVDAVNFRPSPVTLATEAIQLLALSLIHI